MYSIRIRGLIYLLSLILAFICPINATFSEQPDDLKDVNTLFRENYSLVKTEILKSAQPVIISKGSSVVLYYNGKREEVQYIPEIYHHLKEVSHIPVILEIMTNYLEPKVYAKALGNFKSLITRIKEHLEDYSFPKDLVANEMYILDKSQELIQQLEAGKRPSAEGLVHFCSDLTPYLMKNAQKAAEVQLEALHNQTQSWKKEIPREEWNRLAVIVIGPQMPRVGEVSLQYFARVTGVSLREQQVLPSWWKPEDENDNGKKDPDKQNRRLVYAENLWEEDKALDLLATHIIDEEIGQMFFQDKQRMHIDVMAKAALQYLEKKCTKKKDCD